jgi:ABC-type spermidine/putrescine transport system permease subunit II
MEDANLILLAIVGTVVVAPLAREYADLRQAWGLGRLAALATTLLVLPSLGIGLALSLPLAERPTLQWTAAVVLARVVYSLAAAAVRATAERPTAQELDRS